MLAALVRTHRRRVPKAAFDAIPERLLASTRRTSALLRLAVMLHRSHEPGSLPDLQLTAKGDTLALSLPRQWVEARPLLESDLAAEARDFAGLGITLRVGDSRPAR